jgi:hypothetical protein
MAAADARHPVPTQGARSINLKKRDLELAAVPSLETSNSEHWQGPVQDLPYEAGTYLEKQGAAVSQSAPELFGRHAVKHRMDRPRPDWCVLTSPAAGRDWRCQEVPQRIYIARLKKSGCLSTQNHKGGAIADPAQFDTDQQTASRSVRT